MSERLTAGQVPSPRTSVRRELIVPCCWLLTFALAVSLETATRGDDDRRDDPEDRHDGQQFHQRETVAFVFIACHLRIPLSRSVILLWASLVDPVESLR